MSAVFGAGSPGRLVPDRKPSLGQTGVGTGPEEVWAYPEAAVHTERHLLHAGSGQRVAADAAPADQRPWEGADCFLEANWKREMTDRAVEHVYNTL